ncbi:MAG: dTDP-glucose 4,6-dehydratase [Candidatus Komeilibacteria bacterium]
MKLLVTGGAGFIGSNFIHYWLRQHPADQIVNLDALTYAGNKANLSAIESLANYSFILGDITDAAAVGRAMSGVDVVVHFAAESHVDNSIKNALPFLQTNVVGTGILLAAAKELGVKRFHHVSTDEVFGSLSAQGTFNLHSPYDPHSPYSASKAAADHLVRAYYYTYGLPITISNCSNNYGPYQFPEKFLPLMITNILQSKKVPIYGDGSNVRDWLHVLDHIRGIELVLQKGQVGQTYLFGGGQELSNIDLARKVVALMGVTDDVLEFVTDRPGHDWRYAIDSSASNLTLGWQPEYDFESGLKATIDWYREQQNWWRAIVSGAYKQ